MKTTRVLLAAALVAASVSTQAAQPAKAGETLRAIPHSLSDVLEFSLGAPQQASSQLGVQQPGVQQLGVQQLAVQQFGAQLAPSRPGTGGMRRQAQATRDVLVADSGEASKPDGWMTLLSGLIAMLFIAWRKLSR